jgi:predicted nucleic acid-binding protein
MSADEIIAVLDAGPLLHLDELDSLRLLAGYREVLLPEVVESEARQHRPGIQIDSIPGLVRVSSNSSTAGSMFALAAEFGLQAGELAAIAVLKEHHGNCLLSDDAAARALAEAMGFQVRGTVGLILRAWQRKQISKAAATDLLNALPVKSTLHLRPGFLANVLEQIRD